MNAQMKRRLSRTFWGAALAAGALYLPSAQAAKGATSKTVFESELQDQELTANFDVNRDLGRAWIDVKLIPYNQGDDAPDPQVFNEAVDGLYYDQASKQVIYRNGKTRVVCAEDSSFLWTTSLKETGQCRLNVSSEARKVDDGFHVRDETVGKVVFEVSSSPAAAVSSRSGE